MATTVADRLRQLTTEDPQDLAGAQLVAAFASGDAQQVLCEAQTVFRYLDVLGVAAQEIHGRGRSRLAARVARDADDDTTLNELLALLSPLAVGHLPPIVRAERDLARATLAARVEPSSARALYGTALQGLQAIPATSHLGHALVDYAEFLCIAEGPAEALAALAEAAEISSQLRAVPLAERGAAVRSRVEGTEPTTLLSGTRP